MTSPTVTTTYTVTADECPEEITDDVTITISPILVQEVVDDNPCPGEFFEGLTLPLLGHTLFNYSWSHSQGHLIPPTKTLVT